MTQPSSTPANDSRLIAWGLLGLTTLLLGVHLWVLLMCAPFNEQADVRQAHYPPRPRDESVLQIQIDVPIPIHPTTTTASRSADEPTASLPIKVRPIKGSLLSADTDSPSNVCLPMI